MTDDEKRQTDELRMGMYEDDRLARASQTKTIYCNRCVTSRPWSMVLDGGACPDCGYTLSLYGPFEHPPSLDKYPAPQEPRWSACLPVTKPPQIHT